MEEEDATTRLLRESKDMRIWRVPCDPSRHAGYVVQMKSADVMAAAAKPRT